jgi:hypothetical protein
VSDSDIQSQTLEADWTVVLVRVGSNSMLNTLRDE